MTESKILSLALKILGVQCTIYLLPYLGLGWKVQMMAGGEGIGSKIGWVLAGVAPLILYSIAAYVLLRGSDVIAHRLYPAEHDKIPSISENVEPWYRLSFIVLGVWLLTATLPGVIVQTISSFNISNDAVAGLWIEGKKEGWYPLFKGILQTVFSLYLIFRPQHLYRIISKWNNES